MKGERGSKVRGKRIEGELKVTMGKGGKELSRKLLRVPQLGGKF